MTTGFIDKGEKGGGELEKETKAEVLQAGASIIVSNWCFHRVNRIFRARVVKWHKLSL